MAGKIYFYSNRIWWAFFEQIHLYSADAFSIMHPSTLDSNCLVAHSIYINTYRQFINKEVDTCEHEQPYEVCRIPKYRSLNIISNFFFLSRVLQRNCYPHYSANNHMSSCSFFFVRDSFAIPTTGIKSKISKLWQICELNVKWQLCHLTKNKHYATACKPFEHSKTCAMLWLKS